jgi:hypothetical protein
MIREQSNQTIVVSGERYVYPCKMRWPNKKVRIVNLTSKSIIVVLVKLSVQSISCDTLQQQMAMTRTQSS